MPEIATDKFLQAYGSFLVQAWGMPPLKNRFKKDPEKVLKEFGLDPEGAKVLIESPGPKSAAATPESAADLWNQGKKAGKIRFIFPEEPPVELQTQVLSDEQLEAIAGGDGDTTAAAALPVAAASSEPPFILFRAGVNEESRFERGGILFFLKMGEAVQALFGSDFDLVSP